ncbi:type II secretion system protein [Planctomycetota bacterium]
MNGFKKQFGFTLVETIVVVGIIVLLASMMVGIATRIESQGKERLARATLAILNTALEQFKDYNYKYRHQNFDGLVFPLDCNGFDIADVESTLVDAMDLTTGEVEITLFDEANHDANDFGCEVMYLFLNRVAECRVTLDRLDSSAVLVSGTVNITRDSKDHDYPLLRIVDPWGTTLKYDYYDESSSLPDPDFKRVFPVVTSAGPDGEFDTGDDISNR